jgi:PAS domain S-box-containing protein
MPAEATAATSLSASELQLRLEELAGQLRSKSEECEEGLRRESAIAQILSAISEPNADLAHVFNVLIEKAAQLCTASYGYVWLYDGDRVRAIAAFAQQPFRHWLRDRDPFVPAEGSALSQAILHKRLVHLVDATEHEFYQNSSRFRELIDKGGVRTLLHVPLCRGGDVLGVITVYRQERQPFSDRQLALLESFAAQAVIALENARLLNDVQAHARDLQEALEQQTATARVLEVINSSSGELTPVFETILEKAHALCGVAYGSLQLFDGNILRAVAVHGPPETLARRLREGYALGPNHPIRRLFAGEDYTHTHDSAEVDDPMARVSVEESGIRTMLSVALRKDGKLLGRITAGRKEVRPFTDKEIALLQSFATQAVIAIENARLMTEQREALEQQTATAGLLGVINSTRGDLAPVFDTMLEKATRLCEAAYGVLWTYDGENFFGAASRGVPSALVAFLRTPQAPGPGTAIARLAAGEPLVHWENVKDSPAYHTSPVARAFADLGGARSNVLVPLRNETGLLGALSIYRQEVRPFSDTQITLLQNFAAQAVIAMGNARLLSDLRERTGELARSVDELTATSDVLKIISRSSVDLITVLDTLVETASRLCCADHATMFRWRDELFHMVASHGLTDEGKHFYVTHPIAPDRGTVVGRVALERRPVHVVDVLKDPHYTYWEGQTLIGFRTMLGIPLLREEQLIGVFVINRIHAEPFTDKDIELVTTFADQAVIAIENARLFEELRDSQAELRVTIDNMGGGVAMFDADLRLTAWNRNIQQILDLSDEDLAARPSYDDYLRMLADRGEYGTENVEATLSGFLEDPGEELRLERVRPDGTVVEVRRNPVPGGGFVLIYIDITERKKAEAEIAAARDAAEAALERQTATADILKVIASSQTDVQPVLDVVARAAVQFCGATDAIIHLRDGDQALSAAHEGTLRAAVGTRRQLDRQTTFGRAMLDRRTIHVPDVEALDPVEFATARRLAGEFGFRAVIGAPLLREGTAIGAITLRRVEPGAFTPQQVELLETFAAQAIIAIENVRLFNELKDSLEQQTATAEILKVISQSPTDVQPVLDAVAKAARRFCGAANVGVILRDGPHIFPAAHDGLLDPGSLGRLYELDRTTGMGRSIIDARTIHIPDLLAPEAAEFSSGRALAEKLGVRSLVATPMLRDDDAIGCLVLRRFEPSAFTPREIELAETFAAQAVIAIANVRLFTELREALEQQTATADILRVISQSPTDVTPVLAAVAKAALKFCGARDAQVVLRDGDHWFVAATEGPIGVIPGPRPLNRHTTPGRAILDGEVVQIADVQSAEADEFPESRNNAARLGFRSALAAPLLRDDVSIGAIALRRPEPGAFTPNQVELLKSFAAQAVIAIENVRLFTELRDSLERLKAAQANLIQSEKMASLGQLTAGIAHEIKNPLNFVNNFAGLSSELLDELKQAVDALLVEPDENKRAELQETMDLLTGNLAKIVEHGRRADGIVKSMLSHSRGGKGDWQASNINALVEEALNLAYHGARAQDKDFNVTLERDFAFETKSIEVVPQDVTRVLLNLFGNGFYAAKKRQLSGTGSDYRPTLTVSTRDLGEAVEIKVRDNGTGIQPEVRAKLFQPFFTTKPTGEGTGLGLSISYDIVTQQHGGTIEVESAPGSFTEFTVRLPRSPRVAQPRGA